MMRFKDYTPKQQEYITTIGGGAHTKAIEIIGDIENKLSTLKEDNRLLVDQVKALREQMALWSNKMSKIAALAAQLPTCLRSDWDHTNHYELTSTAPNDYFWLDVADVDFRHGSPCETEPGKKLGLIMDIAEEVSRLKDSGTLNCTEKR